MFDESLLSERNLEEQLDLELLAGPIARFGPTERERAIYAAIYIHEQSEHATAWRYGIAPRTMRNVARAMQGRLAEIADEWDQLSEAELSAEWTRLDGLHRLALQAFADTQEDEPRFKHRRPSTDYLLIAVRLGAMKVRLGVEIRRRRKLESQRQAPVATEIAPEPPPTAPEPVAAEPLVRRSRSGRRKILRGRRLRLPGVVGRRPARGVAAVRQVTGWARQRLMAGPWRCGIPPPVAAEAPSDARRPLASGHAARLLAETSASPDFR
jgi:hypothetical protein